LFQKRHSVPRRNPLNQRHSISPVSPFEKELFEEHRLSVPGQPYEGLATMRSGKPQWSGEVRFIPERIEDPLRWMKSRVMFVNSMSDTFHPGVPLEVLDLVFDTMERCPDHTFLLFTKRPERMRVYVEERYGDDGLPSHIWPGTTVESNEYRYRAQILAEIPAAVQFLSCETLLGPLDLENFLERKTPESNMGNCGWKRERLFDWVMVGGESGPGGRPMHPGWVRSLQKLCEAAGTAFWFKQWGEWIPMLGQRHGIPVNKNKYQFPDGEVMGLARRPLRGAANATVEARSDCFSSTRIGRGEWEAWVVRNVKTKD
jgi:protein gp37